MAGHGISHTQRNVICLSRSDPKDAPFPSLSLSRVCLCAAETCQNGPFGTGSKSKRELRRKPTSIWSPEPSAKKNEERSELVNRERRDTRSRSEPSLARVCSRGLIEALTALYVECWVLRPVEASSEEACKACCSIGMLHSACFGHC